MTEAIIILTSLSIGSFGNNIISALLEDHKIEKMSSYCLCGEKKLGILDLIPLISFVFLKGKCSYCDKSLPLRYLIVELLFAAIGILCFMKYGLSVESFFYFIIYASLLIMAVADYYKYIIPNKLIIFLLLITAAKTLWFNEEVLFSILGSIIILVLFISINFISLKIIDKEQIGCGDIKLLAVLFLIFGLPLSLVGLWISAIISLPGFYLLKLFGSRFDGNKIPFGLFIAIGFITAGFCNDVILSFYIHMIEVFN